MGLHQSSLTFTHCLKVVRRAEVLKIREVHYVKANSTILCYRILLILAHLE
jgi:ABC-type microcin C transport system permease subunit YejE